jgi:hypothetical protein
MADVEDAGLLAYRLVFSEDRVVLNRHLPTPEIDKARPEGSVLVVKGRPPGHGSGE